MTSMCSVASATTPDPQQAARFEATRLPDGWSVVDLLCETTLAPSQPWDEATAAIAANVLNATPAYAVLFRWSARELSATTADQGEKR
jgi:hypothetical protein